MSKFSDPTPSAFSDADDSALLDQIYGVVVVFTYSGSVGYSPRQQMEGVVLDLHTTRTGKRQLLIKAIGLNIPKWIDLEAIQFPNSDKSSHA
ncbi:MAG: hypothetical protein ABI700_00465 [Chloroflexota bacterium]